MAGFSLQTIESFDVEVIHPHATNDSLSLTLFTFQPDRLVATEKMKQKVSSETKKASSILVSGFSGQMKKSSATQFRRLFISACHIGMTWDTPGLNHHESCNI